MWQWPAGCAWKGQGGSWGSEAAESQVYGCQGSNGRHVGRHGRSK